MGKRPANRSTSLKTIFSRVKNVCKDNKLREFYFKLLHRIVVTKKELFLFGKAKDTKCPYCGMNDSIIHTFHSCNWSQSFFLEVIKWFNKENVTSFSLSPIQLIFGMKVDTSVSLSEKTGQDQKIEVGRLPSSFHSIEAIRKD